ncbi:MAG: hypothetical protein WC208_08360 [Gallionella sp.]|jgi:hypothetical protein
MKKGIIVRLQFEGYHAWLGAPKECEFLKSVHRHIFHVEAYAKEIASRGIEFITFKKRLQVVVKDQFDGKMFHFSCEEIAEIFLNTYPELYKVVVWEDNENAGYAER